MEQATIVEVEPDASRIMEGLRDTGYTFNSAIADIVDNSIAAGATDIHIVVKRKVPDNRIRVSVADNGCGMDHGGLIAAMRYGAPERPNNHSLGKFGLGLKTASTSCCRRLKVCSRSQENGKVECAIWDLDFIASPQNEGNRWVLKFEGPTEEDLRELLISAAGGPGTNVVWENCDRVLSSRYSNPSTPAFASAFERAVDALKFHLSMTFQRFLDFEDERAENVTIWVNGDMLAPWDPFCRELVDDLGEAKIPVSMDGHEEKSIPIRFYVVPNKEDFQTEAERRRIMPTYKNEALRTYSEESFSGFYIYRENRLIHWGEWFGLSGVDFHSKLCRFELSFDADLDDLFQVDIKKSRIILNEELKGELRRYAAPVKKEGEKRFRKKQNRALKNQSVDMHAESNSSIAAISPGLVESDGVVAQGASEASINNRYGITVVPYSIHDYCTDVDRVVEAVESIEDGVLWTPALINKKRGVQLNSSHEFYKRFYAANQDNRAAVIAMDDLFWALAQAETEAISQEVQENLEEARYHASRFLRKLAADNLPDVSLDDIEGTGSED